MVNAVLDLSGEACPAPLVKTRRAIDKMERGDALEVVIAGEDSKVNILMAAKELGMGVAKIGRDKDGKWHILIRKKVTTTTRLSPNTLTAPVTRDLNSPETSI